MKGIVIDIETLSNTSNAAILEIGAIYFEGFEVKDKFEEKISLQSCLDVGLEINQSTLMWWLKQKRELSELLNTYNELSYVLHKFSHWYKPYSDVEYWANSPSFDIVILNNAYNKIKLESPFKFWLERDIRTIKSFVNVEIKNNHYAINDCVNELKVLKKFYETYRANIQ
jgi:hypothetical protein